MKLYILLFSILAFLASCSLSNLKQCDVVLVKASGSFSSPIEGLVGDQILFTFSHTLECSTNEISDKVTKHYDTWKIENNYHSYSIIKDIPIKILGDIRQIVLFN